MASSISSQVHPAPLAPPSQACQQTLTDTDPLVKYQGLLPLLRESVMVCYYSGSLFMLIRLKHKQKISVRYFDSAFFKQCFNVIFYLFSKQILKICSFLNFLYLLRYNITIMIITFTKWFYLTMNYDLLTKTNIKHQTNSTLIEIYY